MFHTFRWKLFVATAVATTGTAESVPIDARFCDAVVGCDIDLAGSTPEISVKYRAAATEAGLATADYDTEADLITSLTDDDVRTFSFALNPAPWYQFQLVGTAGNGANTTVTLNLIGREVINSHAPY